MFNTNVVFAVEIYKTLQVGMMLNIGDKNMKQLKLLILYCSQLIHRQFS